jgi:hypothetical protein
MIKWNVPVTVEKLYVLLFIVIDVLLLKALASCVIAFIIGYITSVVALI